MMTKIGYLASLLLATAMATSDNDTVDITPGDYKSFNIDHDKPASERYQEVYEYFEEPLTSMVDFWWNFYSDTEKNWFEDNIDGLKAAQPDAYEANLALADFLGLSVV